MKKLLTCMSALVLGLTLASCGSKEPEEPKEEEAKVAYVGLGYDTTYEETAKTDTKGAYATATVNAAFVSFDKDGKILDARIDAVQVKIQNTTAEKGLIEYNVQPNENGYVSTKLELGKNYNMKTFGGSKAEVDVEMETYADWTKGKTAAEVKAALKERTSAEGAHYTGAVYTSDDALWAQVTITVNSFANAIECAWNHKEAANCAADAKAGLSLVGTISEATHGAGYDQVSVDMAGALVKDGKICAALVDAVTFSFKAVENPEEGALAFAHNTTTKYYENGKSVSKKHLGDKYAMKPVSPKEWYEHAALIEAYAIGKTSDEMKTTTAIEGATITISAYTKALSNAAKYATMEHVGPQA